MNSFQLTISSLIVRKITMILNLWQKIYASNIFALICYDGRLEMYKKDLKDILCIIPIAFFNLIKIEITIYPDK